MMDNSVLLTLEPICTLSPNRMQELTALCFVEKVSKGIDPFRMNVMKSAQALYLLKGELELRFNNRAISTVTHDSEQARHGINSTMPDLKSAAALSEIEILRIDLDLLDIMMTWDQLATIKSHEKHDELLSATEKRYDMSHWLSDTNTFSANKLQTGIFSRLPSANIEEMFRRMTLINVSAGQIVVQQGIEGDYYLATHLAKRL